MLRLLLISLCFGTSFFHATAQIVDLELASDSWPPFTHSEESMAVAGQLVREALNRNEIATSTKIIPFKNVLSGLQTGDYDGSAALWKDEEREGYLRFSDPYLQNQLVLVSKIGGDVSMSDLSELPDGTTLGIVDSYSYGPESADFEHLEIVSGESDQANLNALLKGRVEYILIDDLLIHYLMQFQPGDLATHLEVGHVPLVTRSLYFAVREDLEGGEELMAKFNRTIGEMIADGSYHRILKLHWIKADIDGDGKLEMISAGSTAGLEPPSRSYSVATDEEHLAMAATDNTYYIDGTIYQSWDEVPEKYKRPTPRKEDVEDFTFMRMNF